MGLLWSTSHVYNYNVCGKLLYYGFTSSGSDSSDPYCKGTMLDVGTGYQCSRCRNFVKNLKK